MLKIVTLILVLATAGANSAPALKALQPQVRPIQNGFKQPFQVSQSPYNSVTRQPQVPYQDVQMPANSNQLLQPVDGQVNVVPQVNNNQQQVQQQQQQQQQQMYQQQSFENQNQISKVDKQPEKPEKGGVKINNNVSNISVGNHNNANYNLINNLGLPSSAANIIDTSGKIDLNKILRSSPTMSGLVQENGQQSNNIQTISTQPQSSIQSGDSKYEKDVKKAKDKSVEQIVMKEKLIDLASKAMSAGPEGEGDEPLLRFNKETNSLETVHIDPNAKMYKEKLQQALEVLKPNNLSVKKLKRIFGDDEDEQHQSQQQQQQHPNQRYQNTADLQNTQAQQQQDYEQRNWNNNNLMPQRNHRDQFAEGSEAQNYMLQAQDNFSNNNNQDKITNTWITPEEYSMLDRENLVNQVRGNLDDRLNRISDLLYFRPEFMNQLVNIDDVHELTPMESEFKRMILCYSNEQFCSPAGEELNYNEHPMNQLDDEASSYDPVDQQYQQFEEAQLNSDQAQEINSRYNNNNGQQAQSMMGTQNQHEQSSANQQVYQQVSGSESYVAEHSTGGAGVPPNQQQYSSKVSYTKNNQQPALVSQYENYAANSQQPQQPKAPLSSSAPGSSYVRQPFVPAPYTPSASSSQQQQQQPQQQQQKFPQYQQPYQGLPPASYKSPSQAYNGNSNNNNKDDMSYSASSGTSSSVSQSQLNRAPAKVMPQQYNRAAGENQNRFS